MRSIQSSKPRSPVGEPDLAEVDDVHRAPRRDEVGGEALVLAQIEAGDVHRERRHEQDRIARHVRRVVAAQPRVRFVVDDAGRRGDVRFDARPDVVRPRIADGGAGGVQGRLGSNHGVD